MMAAVTVVSYRYDQLADCLSQNKHSFKFTCLCDIFAKMNELNISVQNPDKTLLDVSDKIAVFIKKAIVVEGRYRKRIGKFTVLYFLV